ncbi:MAG: PTS sugar transporter subunit IIA [candidate division WOR-3 bacterium]|nr:PTS sugar transporter subunit IIA [candidate division WOR-3 bacterium]MCX7756976.1 PTS sugar transporter subunit IIA [candidate division WOR-3 bacterium]MDW7987939.1 PTS sugar transporter subunit IIA [candidate division WOR-3 bacterium]
MKKISELIVPEGIILDIKSSDKISVIKELSQILIEKNMISDPNEFFEAILKRENLESTGIGQGVAIPHARTKAVKNIVVIFGRSQTGVDFNSLDGKPSHIIFLIAAPEDKKTEYIITLAKLSKFIRKDEVREKLLKATSKEEVIEIIKTHE